MLKTLIVAVLLLTLPHGFSAQTPSESKKKEAADKFAAETLEFLRETSADVGNMRSIENRISFNAELASLMWFRDDKEARAMYAAVIGDFRQLLTDYDRLLNSPDATSVDEDATGGFLTGGSRSPVERKFRVAMAVRQQIAMSRSRRRHAFDLRALGDRIEQMFEAGGRGNGPNPHTLLDAKLSG